MIALHPGLRAPWRRCEEARSRLVAFVETSAVDAWDVRAAKDAWTVGETIDHLILAEIGTSKMARKLIRGDFANVRRPTGARLHDSTLDRYPYGRFPAPKGLVPRGISRAEALARLDAAHARFLAELSAFRGEDVDALAAEDQDTGWWFTLGGWVCLQALHEEHHLQRLEAERRPRSGPVIRSRT